MMTPEFHFGSPELILQIRLNCLPFYLKAAEESGFSVETIAKAGDVLIEGPTEPEHVLTGFVGIEITRPAKEMDHSPFWRTLNKNQEYQDVMSENLGLPKHGK